MKMRKKFVYILSLFILVLINYSSLVYAQNNVKIIAETDLGGDSDDQATLIRFLLYSNQLDIKGIILSRSNAEFQNDPVAKNPSGASTTLEMAQDYLSAYGDIHNNLLVHDPNYPSEQELKNITIYGHANNGEAGKNHIIKVLKENPGIIWYTNWGSNDGSQSSLDKALNAIQAGEVDGLNYNDVVKRLYYVGVYQQNHIIDHRDNLSYYMDTFFPHMDGGRWYHRWNGITNIENWISNNATTKLCRDYYTGAKESDTQSWTHLIQNGLNIPAKPEWGGWAGRHRYNSSRGILWNDQQDYYNGSRHRDNTLIRWSIPNNATQSEQIQDDFKARILWAQTSSYGNANHHPAAIVNNHNSNEAFEINLEPGSTIQLNASGSSDPDGDNLGFKWDYYKEVSNYDKLNLSSTSGNSINVSAPSDFTKGRQAHIILHVYDDGTPRLTSYKRIIINSGEQTSQSDYLTISQDNYTAEANATQVTTSISSNISWTAESNVDWISVNPVNGNQNEDLEINIQENTGSAQRSGTITISSSAGNEEITVVQKAAQPDFFTVSPLNHNAGPEASTLTSEITANVSWTASSNEDWISFSPENGNQNATLTINIQENTTSNQRSGTITVTSSAGNEEITIVQTSAQQDFFTVSPLNHNAGPEASTLTSEIRTNLSWTASGSEDWFSFSPESGDESITLTIQIDENADLQERTGEILISTSLGQEIVNIAQQGSDQKNTVEAEIIKPVSYQLTTLKEGTPYYIDRDYKVISFPSELDNELLIKTSNDNKNNTLNNYITVNVNTNVDAYVAYDSRVVNLPEWLNDWEKLDESIQVTDEVNYLDLYKKRYPSGQISFPGNKAEMNSDAKANYIIILKENLETGSISPSSESLNIYPNPVLLGQTLNVTLPEEEGLLEIYTINGKLILQEFMVNKHLELNSSMLNRGIHIIRFKGATNQIHERIVVH